MKGKAVGFKDKNDGDAWATLEVEENEIKSESVENEQESESKTHIEQELSRQNLYKTELCRSFADTGCCKYGHKCQFAHGQHELRPVLRHPKYKTEICKSFATTGQCSYGARCRFIHPGLTVEQVLSAKIAASVWSSSWNTPNQTLSTPLKTKKSTNGDEETTTTKPRLAVFLEFADLECNVPTSD